MRVGWAIIGLAFAGLRLQGLRAADLAQIERKLVKEPVYQSKPKYCLLVFGPEAKTRVWLVMDGDTLYVDRNGNGDLTEAGKKVAARDLKFPRDKIVCFDPGCVQDGELQHKIVMVERYVRKQPGGDAPQPATNSTATVVRGYSFNVALEVQIPGRQGPRPDGRILQYAANSDAEGFLEFSDTPRDAPVLHFGGPWQIMPSQQTNLIVGQEVELQLGVGTLGIGPGSTVWTGHQDFIPEMAYPKLEVIYAAASAGQQPIREQYELKKRC
ncbi:MAG TPA: hypothetical protein VGZ47_00230 [Gemmataceae bacterium]|jgi:hypothetical protein|nr:hypothetical protein [Gemmataceae bacterium]